MDKQKGFGTTFNDKEASIFSGEAKVTGVNIPPKYLNLVKPNTKKSKSRKRNFNSKTTTIVRKGRNLSNSVKKKQNRSIKSFLNSFLADSALKNELSPLKKQNTSEQIANKKSSQGVSIGSDSRVYTPDELQQMYDVSLVKYKPTNITPNVGKNGKKVKRGVKTSYGNYTKLRSQTSFIANNKLKLRKGRKSVAGSNKQSFYMSPKTIGGFNMISKKRIRKQPHKLKISSNNSNKAYRRLINNMSMFSLESLNGAVQGKTLMGPKQFPKKIEGAKRRRKGSNASGSRNKYRTTQFQLKKRNRSSLSLIDNRIIVSPTSSSNGRDIIVPRIGSRKEDIKSLTKLDSSHDNQLNSKIQSALGSPSWDVRNFGKLSNKKKFNDSMGKLSESFSEELKTQMNSGKLDSSMVHTFMTDCDILEDVITNLLNDIEKDEKQPESKKQKKRLEVIRYLCNEMNQRRVQNSICKLFGYISQIYESHISTLSVSKLYYLEAQNKKLQQLLEQEKEDKIKITKNFTSQLRELNKMHIQIMEPKEGILDSMNMDSEYEEEGPFVKNGSYTDNEYLGHSHGQDTIGSIHNIFVDPTSEVFLEERKRELAFRKPSFVPDLDFDQLNRLDLKKAVRLKAFGVNKKLLHQSKSQKINHAQSNRIPGERISFTLEGYENDSASETCEKVSNSIEMEERKNPKFKSSKLHAHSHIMVKDVHNVSSNLNEHSQHFSGNISKIQNSCFASSSEATKKELALQTVFHHSRAQSQQCSTLKSLQMPLYFIRPPSPKIIHKFLRWILRILSGQITVKNLWTLGKNFNSIS
ncbi:unnamed protein product [Moneuplotes crassus]|uniref:Uncharacterized protein n=1 Tax=Euplotes crassus TaxID=5936 RepID=A0AAD2D4Q1_EUPCR|nr:unnamed protein product [Moneuplotes crassus]